MTTLLAMPGPLTWPPYLGHIGEHSVTTPREMGPLHLGPDPLPYPTMLKGLKGCAGGQGGSPCGLCDSSAPH